MAGFVLPIISGLAGLFGGGKQQTTNTNTTTNQQNQTGFNNAQNSSTTPNLNPLQQNLVGNFTAAANKNLSNATNLTPYTEAGLGQISGQGSLNTQAISNSLAARGLQYSPVAGTALAQNTINSGNQANSFLQSVPLLQTQLQQQALQQAIGAFSAQPVASSSIGNQSGQGFSNTQGQSQGTQTQYGDPLAGLFGGLGAGLAAPNGSGGNNLSSILKALGIG